MVFFFYFLFLFFCSVSSPESKGSHSRVTYGFGFDKSGEVNKYEAQTCGFLSSSFASGVVDKYKS